MCVEGVAAGCMHRVYAEFVKATLSFRVFAYPIKFYWPLASVAARQNNVCCQRHCYARG